MQIDQQRFAQTSDYEMKTFSGNISSYNMLQFQQSVEEQNKDKLEKFLQRLDEFQNITSLKEAKKLASKILPVKNERTTFRVGEAKCVILNTDETLRIIVDSPPKFVSYDFI